MQPGTLNIGFTRGDDYTLQLSFTDNADPPNPLDYSAMTFAAQLRPFEDDPGDLVEFAVDDTDLAIGVLLLTLTAAQTAELERIYAWDLELIDGADKTTTILAGTVTVKADVTRTVLS